MTQFRKVHRILAFLSFLIPFATYYLTGYPSISFGESGALAAAAFHQQVPAGPGAPLWIVVAGAFAKLLPGDPASILTLFSALCGAFTAMMVYLIAVSLINSPSIPHYRKEGKAREVGKEEGEKEETTETPTPPLKGRGWEGVVGGVIAALSFAWFDSQWSNATQITTRSAGTLIVALVLWSAIQWYHADRDGETGSFRWLLLAAYVAGLALGVDRLALGVIPGVGIIVWMRRFIPRGEDGRYVLGALLAMVGILLLWYGVAASAFPLLLLLAFLAAVGGMFVPKGREAGIACAFLIVFIGLGYSLYTQVAIRTEAHPALNMIEAAPGGESGVLSYMNARPIATGSDELHPPSPLGPLRRRVGHFFMRYLLWNTIGRASDVQDAPPAWFAVSDETREKFIVPTGRDDLFPVRFFGLPLLLALIGLVIHFRSDWRGGIALVTLFLSLGPLSAILWSVGSSPSGEQDGLFAASLLIIALWIGIGAAGLARYVGTLNRGASSDEFDRARGENLTNGILVLCFLLVPVNLLYKGWKTHAHYEDRLPHDFAWNLLQSCDSNAILFIEDASPLRYMQDVEGLRRDVRVIDLSLAGEEWYRNQIREESIREAKEIPMKIDEAAPDGAVKGAPQRKSVGLGSYTADSIEVVTLSVPLTDSTSDSILWYRQGRTDDSGRIHYDVPLQLIRHVVEENNWERPVYFAMTVHPSLWGGLEKFFRWEGLAFRVAPGKDPKGVGGNSEFPIDDRKMSAFFSNIFRANGLNSDKTAFTDIERSVIPLYRRISIAYPDGLDIVDRRISIDAFPLSYWEAAAIASLYHEAGDKRGVEKYARHAIAQIERIGGAWRNDPIARRFNPHQTAARMYALLGDYDKAIMSYKGAGRDWTVNPVLRGLVEELRIERHFVKGDTASGVAELRKIIGEYGAPTDPGMRNNLDAWKEMLEELEE